MLVDFMCPLLHTSLSFNLCESIKECTDMTNSPHKSNLLFRYTSNFYCLDSIPKNRCFWQNMTIMWHIHKHMSNFYGIECRTPQNAILKRSMQEDKLDILGITDL